jgi:hypothetical protein
MLLSGGCGKKQEYACANSLSFKSMRMKKLRSNADACFSPKPKAAARTRKDDLKECIVQALFAAGGVNYLVAVARTQQKVFRSLLANLLTRKEPTPSGGEGAHLTALSDDMLRAELQVALAGRSFVESEV